MTEAANTQLIKDAYAAFLRGDIQAIIDLCTDDVEWGIRGPSEMPIMGIRTGKTGVAAFFEALAEEDEVLEFSPQQFVAQGDTVVVIGHYRCRYRHNGAVAEADWSHIFTIRNGRVARWIEHTDTATFLEAYRAAVPATA
jgi:ketosteroid isomerase-like protein